MGNNLLKRFAQFLKKDSISISRQASIEQTFRKNVELVMETEKDFTPLYDYDEIALLSEEQRKQYLNDIIKKYLEVKSQILEEKRA